MGAVIKVKGKELPAGWAAEAGVKPESDYAIYILPQDPELDSARTLAEFTKIVGERAKRRGLTEDILKEIMDDR